MPLRPLYGHHAIRARLAAAAAEGRLPASLLFTGPRGVGKQRLALWLGQLLLCERARETADREPCHRCPPCRHALQGAHPDLHWYFPLKLRKGSDTAPEEVALDYAEAIRERVDPTGLWSASDGSVGIYLRAVNALVLRAAMRPAMASRAVFVVGDAERMAPQESSREAANAFLKLLEEPPPGTTLVLTSSEPGLLLPTIRSRVVTVRVPRLPRADMEAFMDDAVVAGTLGARSRDDALQAAEGAPGRLHADAAHQQAQAQASVLLQAALQPSTPDGMAARVLAAAQQGGKGGRGAFSAALDALVRQLHHRAQHLVRAGEVTAARRAAASVLAVEEAKARAHGNVNPQLLAFQLLATLHRALVP
jgi:DNA polymerase-3 subunit delta'